MSWRNDRRARGTTRIAVLATVVLCGSFGGAVRADQETGDAVVATGQPPIPGAPVVVAVGEPLIPEPPIVVAVGQPPVPPRQIEVTVDAPPVPQAPPVRRHVTADPDRHHDSIQVERITTVLVDVVANIQGCLTLIDDRI